MRAEGLRTPTTFRHGNLNPARLPIPPRPRRAGRPGGAAYITHARRDTTKIAPDLASLATTGPRSHKGSFIKAPRQDEFAYSLPAVAPSRALRVACRGLHRARTRARTIARPSAGRRHAASCTPGTSGYDGIVPGPALRVRRGEEVRVRLINDLPGPTAVHWHGVRLVNAMDGAPPLTQAPIAPGETFDCRFIAPDAGTYWYHPADWHHAAGQMRRGLYGVLIVTEVDPLDIDHDVTLIFDKPMPSGGAAIDVAATRLTAATSRSTAHRISPFARASTNACGFVSSMPPPTKFSASASKDCALS